jgi:hypothetical protein
MSLASDDQGPQVPVPPVVYKATKALTATATMVVGVLTLVGTQLSDGVYTWGEAGVLIGAVATALGTIAAVWRVPNDPK